MDDENAQFVAQCLAVLEACLPMSAVCHRMELTGNAAVLKVMNYPHDGDISGLYVGANCEEVIIFLAGPKGATVQQWSFRLADPEVFRTVNSKLGELLADYI